MNKAVVQKLRKRMPPVAITADDFADALTQTQVKLRGLRHKAAIARVHTKNHADVRKLLTERHILPEATR